MPAKSPEEETLKECELISGNPDRISISCGRKITDGNYGSHDSHVSYSTDVKTEETLNEAVKRASNVVDKVSAIRLKKAVKG